MTLMLLNKQITNTSRYIEQIYVNKTINDMTIDWYFWIPVDTFFILSTYQNCKETFQVGAYYKQVTVRIIILFVKSNCIYSYMVSLFILIYENVSGVFVCVCQSCKNDNQ